MEVNLDDIDLAIVVNIEILRQVLRKMSVNEQRRWWIACEPEYALERGYLTVAYGCRGCRDPLNTLLYRIPILNTDHPVGGRDRLVVLLDTSVITPEQPGLYHEGNRVVEDQIADMEEFLIPIRRALIPVLAEYSGLDGSRWADPVAYKEQF